MSLISDWLSRALENRRAMVFIQPSNHLCFNRLCQYAIDCGGALLMTGQPTWNIQLATNNVHKLKLYLNKLEFQLCDADWLPCGFVIIKPFL